MENPATINEIVESFERLVNVTKPVRKVATESANAYSKSFPQNPIFKKGKESQDKRQRHPALKQGSSRKVNQVASSTREQALHEMIVQHPFLLHTPELYAGGLYLDALLNKYELPSGHITDFTYITVQDRVIKVTLVEIEKASKAVFHNSIGRRSSFRCEIEAALNQVRNWREEMQNEASQKTLLRKLRKLFIGYPLPIFDDHGNPTSLARIEISYVLVVGNETPQNEAHQSLIDRLYMQEGIIFMTYPMMLEQVRKYHHIKNVLKLGLYKTTPLTLANPSSLLPLAQSLGLPATQNDDPYGVRLAGLGWELHIGSNEASAMHPASIKAIFYRSGGRCEKPGCSRRAIEEGKITGLLRPIYNVIDDDSDWTKFWNTDHVALTCADHLNCLNDEEKHTLGMPHPLNQSMALRKPYRADLDQQALSFTRNWQTSMADNLLGVLEIEPTQHPELAANLRMWLLAVNSLPRHCQWLLSGIVNAYFRSHHRWEFRRNSERVKTDWRFYHLFKARMIRINPRAKPHENIEPAVFSKELIERVEFLFGDRTWMAIHDLCEGNVRGLAFNLERAREDALEKAE